VIRHLPWVVIVPVMAGAQAQEDVVDLFTRGRVQTIDVGAYTLRLLEVDNPESRFDGVTVLWMQVPRDKVDVSIEGIRREGLTNDIYQSSSSGDELVVLSAGFHDSNNQPVGLFVSRGQVISHLAAWTEGGVLYRQGPTLAIVPIRQWNMRPAEVDYAVQAKPLVVESGRNGIVLDDGVLFDRVAIGFTTEGDLLVGGAFRKRNYRALSLYEFGRFMAIPAQSGGPGARTLLGLEGGPGAHIYFPWLQRHFGQTGSDFVLNAIHVRQKGR
jgi:hypothetical protein